MQNTELHPYDGFHSQLRSCNPLEGKYTDYVNLVESGWTTEQAVVNLKLSKSSLTGNPNYQYMKQHESRNKWALSKTFCAGITKKMLRRIKKQCKKLFYHDKDIDITKLGCTLPSLANIYLQKSSDAKFYPFMEGDKDLLRKIPEAFVGGSSINFARKAVADGTSIRKSTNFFKSIVGIDLSRIYSYSTCQPMPTGFYTYWYLHSETGRFTPRQKKTRSFENMVMYYIQRTRPEYKNWKLLHKRQTEKSWQLCCWRVLFSLQHSVPAHG